MKKILFSSAMFLITTSLNAQTSQEKIMEDESTVIVYTPKNYTKEEMARFNRRKRIIPSPAYLSKNPTLHFSNACMDKLEDELNMIIEQDSSLYKASKNCFLSHIYNNDSYEKKTPVRYHQIWTLPESTMNFDHNSLANSLIEMMRDHQLQNLINKHAKFFCQEFEFENKFYLVAIVND